MADTVQKVVVGDSINALGCTFDVAEIMFQDARMAWNEATKKYDIPEYDIEFKDSKGGYHHWKSYLDGGRVIRK